MLKSIDDINKRLQEEGSLKFKIKVIANSKNNSIEFCDDYVKIKVVEPAIEGKANKGIIKFLSNELNIPKSRIILVSGQTSSIKMIEISL